MFSIMKFSLCVLIAITLPNFSKQACTRFYEVRSGDYCWKMANDNGLDMAAFSSLNPSLNCNNLQIGQAVCLASDTITTIATTVAPIILTTLTTQAPACQYPYTIKSGDTCYQIMDSYRLDQPTFYSLNPTIRCEALQIGQVICLGWAQPTGTTVAPTPVATTQPTPIYTAVTDTTTTSKVQLCKRAYKVQPGDICFNIMKTQGIDQSTLYALNPNLDCSNLQIGSLICLEAFTGTVVSIATTFAPTIYNTDSTTVYTNPTTVYTNPTTVYTTAVPTTIAPTTFAPTTIAPTTVYSTQYWCQNPYTVKAGDYCWLIFSNANMDAQTFYSLNPGLDCGNLKIGQQVCIAPVWKCGQYTVVSGDYCWLIMNNNGLTSDQFARLNPGVDCSALQIGQVLNVKNC